MAVRVEFPEALTPLLEPMRYKAVYGGRGSGKSHNFAQAILLLASQKPLRVLCAREVQQSIRDSVKRLLDDKIETMGLGGFFQSTDAEVRGVNGSLFVFSGLHGRQINSIKSMEGIDIVWVEEAEAVSKRSLEVLIPTIRDKGSELWFSWNPSLPNDPVDAMFRSERKPPKTFLKQVTFRDNPWFPAELEEERLWDKRTDLDKYLHVWEGEYQGRSEARVFHNWRVESFERPDIEAAQRGDIERFYFGADWGFSVDPSVLVRCWFDPNNDRRLFIDYEAYKIGCEIEDTPALFAGNCPMPREAEKIWENPRGFPGVPGALAWPITADSARPETISYMRRKGFAIKPARKGSGSLNEGIEWLRNYEIVVHPECRHVVDELTHYRYKVDSQTDEVLPVLQDKKNHTIDAVRYAVEDKRRSRRGGFRAPVLTEATLGKSPNWGKPQ